ncbi:MAG: hypothetical protein GVY07_15565 [Bacteroidetes bacterium]|jgi:hypothetical protein|nr:hypothetical protein [Bacteroidota bacterium]
MIKKSTDHLHKVFRGCFILFVTALIFLCSNRTSNAQNYIQTITITGQATPEDQYSYILEGFEVPKGTGALNIEFDYTGKYTHNEMEIGLFDPDGFRGTSRFSKPSFYISKYRTTPSYFPGPVQAGTWSVSLGFPTIEEVSEYDITIHVIPENHPEYYGPLVESMSEEAKWYSGDFHTHTGHSDAFGCHDTQGNRSPCQVYQVAETAHRNGLDFVSITDHNTVSHHQDMMVIQPTFPDLLLMRGQEVTTFYGHANVIGTSLPIDFRIGYEERNAHHIQQQSDSLGSLFSINHPGRETGASCTGCGWSADSTNYDLVDAVEIVNGTNVENDIAGIPFWHKLLNEGYKITAIGGSDDHSGGFGSAQPGTPTTMVWAESLSEQSILEGVKSGKVYLKTEHASDPDITFYAESGEKTWEMGDTIVADLSTPLTFNVMTAVQENISAEWIVNGEIVERQKTGTETPGGQLNFAYHLSDPVPGWLRLNLRRDGDITIITNPIYIR